MAKVRYWITTTPLGRPLAQAAIDLLGKGDQISFESWVPYPSLEVTKLFWVGWVGEQEVIDAVVAALLGLTGTRTRLGPVRPFDPSAATQAAVEAAYPLPNLGPPGGLIVSRKAALWLHYRDFLLGAFDDDGSPGLVGEDPPSEAASEATPVVTSRPQTKLALVRVRTEIEIGTDQTSPSGIPPSKAHAHARRPPPPSRAIDPRRS